MTPEQNPEYLIVLYDKLNMYLREAQRTGFKEWMFEDTIHEYLHGHFHELFTREVQLGVENAPQ
jgi:hypothetical protein